MIGHSWAVLAWGLSSRFRHRTLEARAYWRLDTGLSLQDGSFAKVSAPLCPWPLPSLFLMWYLILQSLTAQFGLLTTWWVPGKSLLPWQRTPKKLKVETVRSGENYTMSLPPYCRLHLLMTDWQVHIIEEQINEDITGANFGKDSLTQLCYFHCWCCCCCP